MSRSIIVLLSLATLFFPTAASAQQPHWYVLLEPGNDRWYRGANGNDYHEVVTGYRDGFSVVEESFYYDGEVLYEQEERLWLMEDDGDVWLGENCYIDMPLEDGKSWGRTWGEYDQYYTRFAYMGKTDMWGPECIWIRETTDECGTEVITNRFYSDGIGLVHWEVSCFMCSFHLDLVAVEEEKTSWDYVKSLYHH